MTTLFNSELSGRDFGSQLLHTGDLMAWAESKRLHLPDIAGFEFVQVEALLCAIERQDLTPEQAFEIVANDPALKNHRAADDPITAMWLLGAAAHKKWRELLSVAIERHELTLLDFASKLPINAPATDTATPAPVAASEAPAQRAKRRSWLDVTGVYITEILRAGQYANGKALFNALESKAGTGSPFDKGVGANRGSLFVRELSQTLTMKTVQNNWEKLLKTAAKN